MPITALPTPPSPADTPAEFNSKAFTFLGALANPFVGEANTLETNVNAKEASAVAAAAAALASEQAADASEAAALASKNAAAASETSAATSATSAAASYDSFDDRYLGPKAVEPTTDNDGNALLVGALYWNTGTALMYVWTGSVWSSAISPLTVPDNQLRITGSADATKIAMFDVDGLTAGVTRTYALPDASTTLVGIDVAQVLTNKTFGDNPVFSAGSVNGVPYLNSSKVLTTDAAKLSFDGTNLGIGTSAPVYKLDVSGSVRLKTGTTGTPVIVATGGDSQGTLRFGSASAEYSINGGADYLAMIFNVHGAEAMRLIGAGLVVGATAAAANALSTAKLTVASPSGNGGVVATDMGTTASLAQNESANTYSFGGYGGVGILTACGADPNTAWRACALVWSSGAALQVYTIASNNITVGVSGTTVTVTNTNAGAEAIAWSMLRLS